MSEDPAVGPAGDDPKHEDPAQRRAELAQQADHHAETLRRRQERESAEAQVLIDAFIVRAEERGLPTEELMARPWSGRGSYRTGVTGWHLRQDQSIGLSVDGQFYVLVVAPQRLGRWRTVTVEPSPPPLHPGLGARDGEALSLDALLESRLRW